MKKMFLFLCLLSSNAYCATSTPTAALYEIKAYTQATITANTKNGDLPKPIATYLPYILWNFSGNYATITTQTKGSVAKVVQTKGPSYSVTIISVKPVPTPTVSPTVSR